MAEMTERTVGPVPHAGLLARVGRFVFGERVKRARISDHGALMRTLGAPGRCR